MQNPPMMRFGSLASPAQFVAMNSHSGLCSRKCAKISAIHASGPSSSNSRAICSRVDSATRGNLLISPPIPVHDYQCGRVPVPRLPANNTPIATLQYPTRTGEIREQMAAVEHEFTTIKAAFVESLIISFGTGGARSLERPTSQILWLLKER